MKFYVQMKWNYQGRISQDELWKLESQEGDHGLEGIKSGMVKGLYKVAGQHRVLAIVDVDSIENLDRQAMGWLPMREYLEFEQVWALRDYAGFIDDVKARFPTTPPTTTAITISEDETRRVAEGWFANLFKGSPDSVRNFLAEDILWENIPSTPGVSDIAPWLGTCRGIPAVLESFATFAKHSKVLGVDLQQLVVEGENAVGIFTEHGQCLANLNRYELQVVTQLQVGDGKIRHWKAFWDPSPLIRAYKNL